MLEVFNTSLFWESVFEECVVFWESCVLKMLDSIARRRECVVWMAGIYKRQRPFLHTKGQLAIFWGLGGMSQGSTVDWLIDADAPDRLICHSGGSVGRYVPGAADMSCLTTRR